MKADPNKPPYRVPLMPEIEAIPWNGLSLVSTFSGCGGSCLGFRMAGFKTLWASEFILAAREVYALNHPGVPLDSRDIRQVSPEDILTACKLKAGKLDVLEGSPPCASFSTAGKRQETWGKIRKYSDTQQRNDDLFFEFIRLVRGLQPKVFVAENVSGLVKGSAKGYFKEILIAMKASGYRVKAQLLDAQWLGVPQQRQRIIFMGVRNDLGIGPAFPKPLSYRYSVRDAFGEYNQGDITERPAPAVTAQGIGHLKVDRLPPSILKAGAYAVQDVHPEKPCPTVTCGSPGNDLAVPLPADGDTDISRYAIGREWDKLKPGEQSKKYFSLVKTDQEKPSPSIMASSGAFPSAAQPLHPTERRKFTIAELKRICAFPDDFQLTGTYAQQWERLGRAVPPVMMKAVALCVKEMLND